jgi:hypothetical protein
MRTIFGKYHFRGSQSKATGGQGATRDGAGSSVVSIERNFPATQIP